MTGANATERFWTKVDVRGPDDCWEWTAARNRKGYGDFGRWGAAHRYAWTITNGPIPAGMLVCHRCDNPPCVNPAHLFLGTPAENMADMMSKGRHRIVVRTRLTDDEVREIRRRVEAGETSRAVAPLFGVSYGYVSQLARREWRTDVEDVA